MAWDMLNVSSPPIWTHDHLSISLARPQQKLNMLDGMSSCWTLGCAHRSCCQGANVEFIIDPEQVHIVLLGIHCRCAHGFVCQDGAFASDKHGGLAWRPVSSLLPVCRARAGKHAYCSACGAPMSASPASPTDQAPFDKFMMTAIDAFFSIVYATSYHTACHHNVPSFALVCN